ncbi:hypothetical protein PSQ19_09620 [Devosia algicola]|uniref:Uncharacterized protein n=1 Tax=Devosia algicola TaxID=3026418 RepID=A0ABY7YIQ7_9HYPH|nr:hypothetical protein [Devosia algicola]WDR01151.1 hypothetical protein PSQ19_09620 [Devosia algicola]
MADYKELLRRAISALPENNGAARRAVYEKARSALVGQLRAINPPLPARDITQHRLQLEDCIRQVEQEASEAVISLRRDFAAPPERSVETKFAADETPATQEVPEPEPDPVAEPELPKEHGTTRASTDDAAELDAKPTDKVKTKHAAPPAPAEQSENAGTGSIAEPVVTPPTQPQFAFDASAKSASSASIEDIISAAEAAGGEVDQSAPQSNTTVPDAADNPDAVSEPNPAVEPEINTHPAVAPPNGQSPVAAPNVDVSAAKPSPPDPVADVGTPAVERRPPSDGGFFGSKGNGKTANLAAANRVEPAMGAMERARDGVVEPVVIKDAGAVESALSSEREVDVDAGAGKSNPLEAEGVIERAIETLDREARGEKSAALPDAAASDGDGKRDDAGPSGAVGSGDEPWRRAARRGTDDFSCGLRFAPRWRWRRWILGLARRLCRSGPDVRALNGGCNRHGRHECTDHRGGPKDANPRW